jgi:hypothetical protein
MGTVTAIHMRSQVQESKAFIGESMQNQEVSMSPDLLRQRRAVHHALCYVLTEDEAESALSSWEKHFDASGSAFSGLNVFAREVCETYAKSGRHRELVQAISRALVSKEGDLRPLPDAAAISVPELAAVAVNSPQPVTVVQLTSEQKRAIHQALRSVLSEAEADSALITWEQHFAKSGSAFSGLNQFAREVCEAYGKTGRQRELTQAISRVLVSKDGALQPPEVDVAPSIETSADAITEIGQESASGGDIEPAVNTAEFKTFQPLLLALLVDLDQHQVEIGRACRAFLADVINNLPWSPAQQEQLVRLLYTGSTVQKRHYRPGQLKTLMHHMTVWMREKLSKDVSLLMVNRVIGEISKTEAGRNYSPKKFFS